MDIIYKRYHDAKLLSQLYSNRLFFWNSSITNYLNVYIVSLQFTFLTASLTISALLVMSTDVEKTF